MIKVLLKSIREYKKASIIAPILTIGGVAVEVAIPFRTALLIDNGIIEGDMSYIIKEGVVLIILCIISLICGVLSGKFASYAATGFSKNLRKDMYDNIQKFSFSNIDKFSTASIITRLTTDVSNIQNSYQMIMRIVVKAPITLVMAFTMAFYIDHKLSMIFLGAMLILSIGLYFIIKKAYPIFQKVFERYDKLNNIVQENLNGIRVVKSYVREDFEEEKFYKISQKIFKDYLTTEKLLMITNPLMNLVMNASLILLAYFGAKFIVSGDLMVGSLTTLITYTGQILMSLMLISIVLVMLVTSKASAERISQILIEETDIKEKSNPKTEIKTGNISFKNVGFSYTGDKNKRCLKNINVDIKAGEIVGIIGGTGSSKTTFVQLIPRLYNTLEGSVSVGGIDVTEYSLQSLRESVAIVLQKNILFSGTIKENLRWGNKNATDEEMKRACKIACADTFIENLTDKYDTYIEQGGSNVSGGQKQRICIARALLKNPKILILDDSTSAVDTKTDAIIREALKKEIPDITQIIISQRISSIQHADKIIVMDNGEINQIGTHIELIQSNDIYKEVYNIQNRKVGEKNE